MKKYLFIPSLCAALVLLTGASVWEGAAAVSADFPQGLYAATNSFPKNTVVDVTNLETDKTVRVIVSASLDSPGLLALLSREAAEAVGLQYRTIGRIRMAAPQDPIAFSRFTGDQYRSGDPDYDPVAAVENAYPGVPPAAASGTGTVPVSEGEPSGPASPPAPPVVITVPVPDPSRDEKPAVTEDVPAAVEKVPDTPLRRDPDGAWTDVPAAALPPADPPESEKSVKPEPEPAAPPSPPPEPPKAPEPDLPQTTDAAALANGGREPVVSDLPVEHLPEKAPPAAPPELPPEEPAGIPAASAEPPAPPPEEPFAGPEPSGGEYNYTLIPAEERPPAGGSLVAPPAVSPPPVPQIFSVPAVARLEYGKYYLQIGAYSQTAAVERELSKIERGYPLTVQCAGTAAKPVYRILVGPVNQGESGALLRSFKGKGYKDAFVRRGE